MADKIYTEHYRVTDTEIDFSGRMTMQAMMTIFQNMAGAHASGFNLGFEELQKRNLAWVLAKTYIRIHIPPTRGQRIKVTTWPGKTKRCFYPRYFTVLDEQGNLLCACSTLWVIIHSDTRELFVDREGMLALPDTSELEPPAELPKKIKLPPQADQIITRSPQYSEIDINHHLNNTKYVSWICDLVGTDHFKSHFISELYLVYSNEIRPDDTIQLSRYLMENSDIFHGVNQEGLSCFQAQLHWARVQK